MLEKGTTNTSNGTFEIEAKENDTLLFSSVQYENMTVIITNKIYREKYLKVKLKKDINELPEVLISNISLTGNLTTDLANIKIFNQAEVGFPLRDYKKPTEMDRLYGSLSSSPISLLINTFNGKIKRIKTARKLIKFDKIVDKGINSVSLSYFTTELSVPEKEILNFVIYCAQNEDFRAIVAEEATIEIMDCYYNTAPQFLKTISSSIKTNVK